MKVSEVMTADVRTIGSDGPVLYAAKMMAAREIGMLPVSRGEQLIGVVTDRDIVVRVVARGDDPAQTLVGDIVSADLQFCFEDEDTQQVADRMDQLRIRRLPVVSRERALVGIVSIEDLRPRGGSQGGIDGRSRNALPVAEKPEMPAVNPIDEAIDESFPASDPPGYSPTRASPGR